MAQERPATPEKQLLKLIEESKTPAAGVNIQAIRHRNLSLFSLSAWLGRISFFKDRFKKWFGKNGKYRQLDIIRVINNALAFSIFVLAIYFISNLSMSMINLKKMTNLKLISPESVKSASLIQDASSLARPLSYYLEKVRARNIFKMGPRKVTDAAEVADRGPSSRIIEATQHLKLVGISWSNDPDAMIEDTKALRTFFVKRSQMIGDIKVQAIFKDKVILGYEGEEIELR